MNENEFNKIFAKNLNRQLEEHDMTQKELAQRIGVSTSTVSTWCTGQKTPRMDKVDKICRQLFIERSDLLTEHDEITGSVIFWVDNKTDQITEFKCSGDVDNKYTRNLLMRITHDSKFDKLTQENKDIVNKVIDGLLAIQQNEK